MCVVCTMFNEVSWSKKMLKSFDTLEQQSASFDSIKQLRKKRSYKYFGKPKTCVGCEINNSWNIKHTVCNAGT